MVMKSSKRQSTNRTSKKRPVKKTAKRTPKKTTRSTSKRPVQKQVKRTGKKPPTQQTPSAGQTATTSAYDELMRQTKIIKDRVRGVVNKQSTGFYLYGAAGVSKTYSVCTTLRDLGVNFEYSNGHLAPIGLFDLISENRDRVIVLDDVSSIFKDEKAKQILLAALGNSPDDTGVRWVRHKTARSDRRVDFTGGIIAISNLSLDDHKDEVIKAVADRVFTLKFDPTQDQLIALCEHIAKNGVDGRTPKECLEVLRYLVSECEKRDVRLSVRLFVDKAMKDYGLWKAEKSESHWKDLIVSNLEQQLVELQHPTHDLSRAEQMESERRIAADIYFNFDDRQSRIEEWKERTRKSQQAFYRRLKEAKRDGLISED